MRSDLIRRVAPLLLVPSLLSAQGRCVDSLGGANWRSTPLRALVTSPAPGERDADRYADQILPRLAQRFHDPTERLQASARMISVAAEGERIPVAATLRLRLDRNGRLLSTVLTAGSGNAALDSSIVEAAQQAAGERGFGKAPRKFRGDTLEIVIAISDRHPNGPRVAPLGNVSSSYLVADVPPRIRSMPPARAPRSYRPIRGGRPVMLAATVNSQGRVVPGSIRVISAADTALVPIARRSLERSVYRPGTRNGCPAESYIRQNFPFP